jgi:anthranilate synthase component 1
VSVAHLAPGSVLPLVRSISGAPDPLDLFVKTCDGGMKLDTLLLESGDTADRRSEKSLIVVGSALRISCHSRVVEVNALNANGKSILPWLANKLGSVAKIDISPSAIVAHFAPPIIGDEESRLKAASPVDVLRSIMQMTAASSTSAHLPLVAGVFSYDFLDTYESLPPPAADDLHWPDFEFWLPDRMIWIQHRHNSAAVVAHVFGGEFSDQSYHDAMNAVAELSSICSTIPPSGSSNESFSANELALEAEVDISDDEYMQLVEQLKKHVDLGDVFQIVPSRTFRLACSDPVMSYRKLRTINPSPYMFFVNGTRGILFGSSPETSVKVDGTPHRVEIRPIAGTRRRARTESGEIDKDLDSKLEADLRLDEKEIAEHMMLVDLARNDVARVSEPGTRTVDKLLAVERYSHVMHLVSQISGRLRSDLDALHAYVAAMNMGTLVGAPKLKAAELLRLHEKKARGPYGGAVGYFTADGRMDTSIVIRSAVVANGIANIRAGAGVVADSVPEMEMVETRRKAEAVLRAIAAAPEKIPAQTR